MTEKTAEDTQKTVEIDPRRYFPTLTDGRTDWERALEVLEPPTGVALLYPDLTSLIEHIRERIEGPRQQRTIYQETINRFWPASGPDAQARQIEALEQFAIVHGWTVWTQRTHFHAVFRAAQARKKKSPSQSE